MCGVSFIITPSRPLFQWNFFPAWSIIERTTGRKRDRRQFRCRKMERNEELEYIDDFENIEEPEESEDNREELEEPEEEYSEGGRRRKKGRKSDTKNAASVAGEFLRWVITIVAAVLIAMFLNRFVLINAEIPSGSMENTIMTGDKLIGSDGHICFPDRSGETSLSLSFRMMRARTM